MTQIPTRLLVLQRLTAHLEQTPGFDLTGKVFRGRILYGKEVTGSLPALSILESPRSDANVNWRGMWSEMRSDGWPLLIQGLVDDDPMNPTDPAYALEAAVEQQLAQISATDSTNGDPVYPDVFNLGRLITHFHIGPPTVRPPEDKISATAFFFLPVWVGMSQMVGEPYTTV